MEKNPPLIVSSESPDQNAPIGTLWYDANTMQTMLRTQAGTVPVISASNGQRITNVGPPTTGITTSTYLQGNGNWTVSHDPRDARIKELEAELKALKDRYESIEADEAIQSILETARKKAS